MSPDKNSLSIQLTEPVVSLRSTSTRASRHHASEREALPPAIVRGLLTLTLAKPMKVSSIELELQAKATTRYTQGAGPSRTDVTEQYKVHSASTVLFKAASVPHVRPRSTPLRPGVQFPDDDHTASDAQHSTRFSGLGSAAYWQAPSDACRSVARSASVDPRFSRTEEQSNSEHPGIDDDRNQHYEISNDLAPPYSSPAGQLSFSGADSYPSATSRSQSVASSSRIAKPQSSPDLPGGSPGSNGHLIRDLSLPRTSSIEEVPEGDSESFEASSAHLGNVSYYGLSRIATSSPSRSSKQDYRGRSHSQFSFGRVVHIFDAMKDRVRSQSPEAGSLPRLDEREKRGRSLMRGKGKAQVSVHGVGTAQPRTGATEPSAADGVNVRNGDDWIVFSEGTYTYPILFTIPNDSPPTMKAEHGSLVWKVKAEVKRPSALKLNMSAQKEVVVICLPNDDDSEEAEGLDLQRQWENQFQYRIHIAGHGVPVGGKVPIQLTIMPLARIKVHSISVYLDERTAYFTRAETQARSDAIRRATLLAIRHNNSDGRYSSAILPLASGELDAFRNSPLYRFLSPGEDEREAASSFAGSGPWTIHHDMRVPDSCSILYPSNRAKGSNVMTDHTLKIVLRVEKEEETTPNRTKKLYDIVIHTPIQILSCYCTSEWMSLPRYDDALRSVGDSPENILRCPCRTRQSKARKNSYVSNTSPVPLQRATSLPNTNSNASGACGTSPPDSLANQACLHELLMSGFVSERGEVPPSYEPVHL